MIYTCFIKPLLPVLLRFFITMIVGGAFFILCLAVMFLEWIFPISLIAIFATIPMFLLSEFIEYLLGISGTGSETDYYVRHVPFCVAYFSVLFAFLCEITRFVSCRLSQFSFFPRFILEMVVGETLFILCFVVVLMVAFIFSPAGGEPDPESGDMVGIALGFGILFLGFVSVSFALLCEFFRFFVKQKIPPTLPAIDV